MKKSHEVLGVKIVGVLQKVYTQWAGASLLVGLYCRTGLDDVANKVLPAKRSAKGLSRD